ncbi:MAG: hypothetical protein R3325_00095 [Thermoanaerobaculia bacterium]|nr:hypothetical protein [Thermoanaerobaculia bacterium]
MTRWSWRPAVLMIACLGVAACDGSPAPVEKTGSPPEPAATEELEASRREVTVQPWNDPSGGAVEVLGDTRDWFDVVHDDGTRAFPGNPPVLGNAVAVAPGTYRVRVNNTERRVTVRSGEKIVLRTGTLIVEGTRASFWAPYLGDERMVALNPPTLGSALALLPGSYRVELTVEQNRTVVLAEAATVEAGRTTTLRE